MNVKQDFEVKGMHCNSCAKIIEDRLLKLKGINEAKASFEEEKVTVGFNDKKIVKEDIESELATIGYLVKGSNSSAKKMSFKEGIIYGLVPHIGCIGFIIASVLGVTVAVEFFKPLLMNPWFFHILILLSIGFATLSSAFYLRKNNLLSWVGVKRKKVYLATMYGSTVGINIVLFLFIFPTLANLDTGSFSTTGAVALDNGTPIVEGASGVQEDSFLRLQVDIPCPGHAPLISGELKTIVGVTGVRFEFPNYFDVAYNAEASKEQILALEVFETYSATLISESAQVNNVAELSELNEVKPVIKKESNQTTSTCAA